MLTNGEPLHCDGCGQAASPEHLARRLQRLEWATRYRPIHIATLFLGAFGPEADADFLYAPAGAFTGEAASVLEAAGIAASGKPREAVLSEFQRGGFFLAHALECPAEGGASDDAIRLLLVKRLPPVVARIRRSLKPKKVVLMSPSFASLSRQLQSSALGCEVVSSSPTV